MSIFRSHSESRGLSAFLCLALVLAAPLARAVRAEIKAATGFVV